MELPELRARRLIAQGLASSAARPATDTPLAAARHLLAVQGQTYDAGIRALALRISPAAPDDAAVLSAVGSLAVVRSWPVRGTLHFLAAEDVRWLSRLSFPRVGAGQAQRRPGLGLSEPDVARARDALQAALRERGAVNPLTRAEAYAVFAEAGVSPEGGRGPHLLRAFSGEGDVAQGPRGPQGPVTQRETFIHVDDLPVEQAEPDDPLTELGTRYVAGHGPACSKDLATWAYLTATDAKAALARARDSYAVKVGRREYFLPEWQGDVTAAELAAALELSIELPAFDEYLLGYAHKEEIIPDEDVRKDVLTSNGLSWPWMMEGGIGTRSLRKN
ncbi:winged helix DNA-binding domain-containing protein [uncultured Corynebacterium sp.]|uniref:winged helix DNA-binding domain-containing protein n=1 Tax=uncultured Corynebacterium sp. TaxID=159447 RepID=UPI0025F06D6C|nr:winged helix DNA-binding domain-containing protein [uncultured Corynebacterium sp.]